MKWLLSLVLICGLAADAQESARALLSQGTSHEKKGQLDEAERDYAAALAAAERLGDAATRIDALSALGYIQYYRGEFNDALINLQRAYDLARKAGNEKAQRTLLATIAHVYADPTVAQYDRAIDYYRQILAQQQSAGEATDAADTLFNIGSTYERKEDFNAALDWYRRALAAEEKLKRGEDLALVKRAMAVTLGKVGRTSEALPLLDEALRVFTATGNTSAMMQVRQSRGVVHRRAGHIGPAIADLEATRVFYESQKNTRFLEKTEEELALVYAAAGRWRDAYEARTRDLELQRELAEKLREAHTSRLRVQFDAERKEQENRGLLRQNAAAARIRRLQAIILILGAIVIAILAYLMIRMARDERRMRDMAMTDDLTRLPNRRHVFAAAESQLQGAQSESTTLSLIEFDLDLFKRINDTFGHATGDIVLQRVAHACRGALRPGDLVGRIGGEEFLAVLPMTDATDAVSVAERLRIAVEAIDFNEIDPSLRVTISLGVATSGSERSLAQLLAIADERLYRAKEQGRNRVAA